MKDLNFKIAEAGKWEADSEFGVWSVFKDITFSRESWHTHLKSNGNEPSRPSFIFCVAKEEGFKHLNIQYHTLQEQAAYREKKRGKNND